MEHSTEFKLEVAIGQYLREIDRGHLLDREEREELIDHLLTETEALQEEGLSEKEAFALSKQHFGATGLISREYEKAKPFGALKRMLVTGLMFYFSMLFIFQVLSHLTIVSFLAGNYFGLTPSTAQLFDLGLKLFPIGCISVYLVYRLQRRPYFSKAELWLIPILGTLFPRVFQRFWSLVHDPTGLYTYQKDMLENMFINTGILSLILLLSLVITHVIQLYKNRRQEYSPTIEKKVSTSLMVVFYLVVIQSGISLVGFLSFYGGTLLGFAEPSIKIFDLVLKAVFVLGAAAYLIMRLKKQQFFHKIESSLIPLLALALPVMAEFMYIFFDFTITGSRKFIRVGIINSWTINLLAVLILMIGTYVMVAQEQRRLTRRFF